MRKFKSNTGSPGFALLKVWFDTWKPLGVWSTDMVAEDGHEKHVGEGILVVGPILGELICLRLIVAFIPYVI